MSMKTVLIFFSAIVLLGYAGHSQSRQQLLKLLGRMPEKPALQIDTLEKTRLEKGWRYKIRYLAEDTNVLFHTPKDYIPAYLFIPDAPKGNKVPAIVAIHQDGPRYFLGKSEPAGLGGDADQHYGLELFERGYVVICPDRFYHAERRRIPHPDSLSDYGNLSDLANMHWAGQLLMEGRTSAGKEVYDLRRTLDVLCKADIVDTARIGAIGHSAGGYALAYFMFADKRIKAGVSSCGVFELMDWYDEQGVRKRYSDNAIPGLAGVGRTSDYIGYIAPRPFLMTRGLYEWGAGSDKEKLESTKHVEMTRLLEAEAGRYYKAKKAEHHFKTIYFDENVGNHSFPPLVKEQVYEWLDKYLKK